MPTIHRLLIVNHALRGEIEDTKHELQTLKRLLPTTSLRSINEWLPFVRTDERQKVVEASPWHREGDQSKSICQFLMMQPSALRTEVTPKFISPTDPAARWTGAHGGQAFFG